MITSYANLNYFLSVSAYVQELATLPICSAHVMPFSLNYSWRDEPQRIFVITKGFTLGSPTESNRRTLLSQEKHRDPNSSRSETSPQWKYTHETSDPGTKSEYCKLLLLPNKRLSTFSTWLWRTSLLEA